ncbi:substrate-binding domain-containing protein [Cellulosimicrobium protaetiae]|uniref:Substrate-binding domain-containing protein n=1 Tax=Cellulosimicrobium protaetiae TaxID=2587808 RepID=A0A6M5U9Y6_9MICO|nr:substrate-binding domain-containing protein [Cellulosimicrobium protaetiae]QJW35040.1 substrate-binding domain-containing protein [Cellulosimicrobium protaetiae]
MKNPRVLTTGAALGALLLLAACTTDSPTAGSETAPAPSESTDAGGAGSEWFVQADYDRQLAQREIVPEGPADQPWLQAIEPEYVDTAEFASAEGGNTLCFSNASVSNPWRVTGWITMQQQVDVLKSEGVIGEFRVSDAADDDNKQISDIQAFVNAGDCDAIIISPSTTATLTPAVEAACESGKPVIVFDRGVNTDCMVTFIHPIGGYAYGAAGADFLVENLEPGSTVLGLRVAPGVDVLENRWAAADKIFSESELEVVGAEFTGGDGAKIKDIVTQYLQRGDVDGIWMDAGDGAVAAVEAFEDAGKPYPVMVGEDEMSFLRTWKESDLTAVAPVYSNFQWRTPILAAQMIWAGEQVPSEWVLPQSPIEAEELDAYLEANKDMPSLHYAKFGGEDLPGFPEAWTDR